MRIFFATNLSRQYNEIMQDEGIEDRLISYYDLRKDPDERIQDFVQTGVPNPKDVDPETRRRRRRVVGQSRPIVSTRAQPKLHRPGATRKRLPK